MKNMVSYNAASTSKAAMMSMGSFQLLLWACYCTEFDLKKMGGMTLPREVLRVSLSGLVSCGW